MSVEERRAALRALHLAAAQAAVNGDDKELSLLKAVIRKIEAS